MDEKATSQDLFRWSKNVSDEDLEWWETELEMAGLLYTAEKSVGRKNWQLSVYEESREAVDELKKRYGGGAHRVSAESWQHSTGDDLHAPIKIRDRFIVTGASEAEDLDSLKAEFAGRDILSFPPRLAFGTGEHPTTANCLRFLVDASRQQPLPDRWEFLDVGCGSGILAIAAKMLGAGKTDAIEFDPLALDVAIRNGDRHATKDISWIEADALAWLDERKPTGSQYPVVAANLFSTLLVEMFPKLAPHLAPNAIVIVSGFLTTQTSDVVAAAKASGIELKDFTRRGKWVAAMGRKP